MMEKSISCPTCGKVLNVKGKPGEKITITCPTCNTWGYFQFPTGNNRDIKEKLWTFLCWQLPYTLVFLYFLFSFIFQENDVLVALSLIILIPLFILLKFDKRIPFIYTVLLLFASAFALAFYKEEFIAKQLAISAYWLMVVGVTCLFIEFLIDQRTSKRRKCLV